MAHLNKVIFSGTASYARLTARALALLSLLLAAAVARGQAYYSSGQPTVATPSTCGTAAICGGVDVASSTDIASLTLAAKVYAGSAIERVQLQLTGTAPAGYRAGMLVSSLASLASLDALSSATLRTYLDTTLQETKTVDLTVLKAALLAGNGSPEQLEFTSRLAFNRVELKLGSVTKQLGAQTLGAGLRINYAYGVPSNQARQVTALVSRFDQPGNQYDTGGCTSGISNPERTTDTDLTNYATFASLATVKCSMKLKVNLEATAPANYKAGFVVGGLDNLVNADLLGGIQLRTYLNGVPQESATGAAVLGLSVLSSGQSFVSFPATKAFNAVSIERTGTVTALDNMQLYYGTGVASVPATQMRSQWSDPTGHFSSYNNGVLCVSLTSCGISNPANAADDNLSNYASLSVTAGVANSAALRLDINGTSNTTRTTAASAGLAGNRAGVVLAHQGGLLDAQALSRVVLTTYDDKGNVLETESGSQLLRLEILPDGRQAVSFNTTRDFAAVGVQIGGVLNVVDNTNVYYAFADDTNGVTNLVAPSSPLPVQLVGLAVQRQAGAAQLSWATASEVNSLRFVVERSASPQQGFTALGVVAAAGNSATTRQYGFRDAGAAAQHGPLYYRLRQEDQDGTATYSPVVVLAAAAEPLSFSLYPNPATRAGGTALSLTAPLPAGSTVALYSAQGQVLGTSTPAEGQTDLRLATQSLAAGLYYVVLRDASGQRVATQRLQVLGE